MAINTLPALSGVNNASSRRSALLSLAGAAFLPMAVAAAAPAFASTRQSGAWEAALAEYRAAEGAMQAFDLAHLTPASDAYSDARSAYPKGELTDEAREALAPVSVAYEALQVRFDALVDAHGDAALTLIVTPAPDAAAMAEKVRLIITHDVAGWNEDSRSACLAAILADADSFAAREA